MPDPKLPKPGDVWATDPSDSETWQRIEGIQDDEFVTLFFGDKFRHWWKVAWFATWSRDKQLINPEK